MRSAATLSFLICIAATTGVFFAFKKADLQQAESDFSGVVAEAVLIAQDHVQDYTFNVESVTAFFSASDSVTKTDFRNFTQALNLTARLPEVRGIGFVHSDAQEFYVDTTPSRDQERGADLRSPTPNTLRGVYKTQWLLNGKTQPPSDTATIHTLASPATRLVNGVSTKIGWVYLHVDTTAMSASLSNTKTDIFNLTARLQGSSDTGVQGLTSHEGLFHKSTTIYEVGQAWDLTFYSTHAFDARYPLAGRWTILWIGAFISALIATAVYNRAQKHIARKEVALFREREFATKEVEKHSILENAVAAIVIFDDNDHIIHANSAACEVFGYTQVEMAGMPFSTLAEKETSNSGAGRFNAIGRTQSGTPLQLFVQHNRWFTASGAPRTTAVIRNVTTEQEAVQQLAEAENRFKLALQGARIGVFEINLTDNTSQVSETWLKIMGLSTDMSAFEPQTHFLSRVHPEDLPMLLEADRACIAGETPRSVADYRVSFGENTWRWMRSDAVIIKRDEDGVPIKLIGTQTDVTDLKESQTALEVSQMRFRMAMKAAPVGTALLDADGRFTMVNTVMCEFLQYSAEDLRTEVRFSDILDPEDFKQLYRTILTNFAQGKTQSYQGEHQVTLRSGIRRWGLISASTAFDESTQSPMFIVQVTDIEDQKEVDRMKTEFVSTISHELRTPLTSITGAIGIVQATAAETLTPTVSRLIDIAKSNSDRLTTLINDILDLEKISSRETHFILESFDLNTVAQNVVAALGPLATTYGNTIQLDMPETDLIVLADPDRMSQVFENLISNACKYSAANTTIKVKIEAQDGKALVFVLNEGDCIPSSFRHNVFKAFAQADSSDTRSKGGTGLGLNITKQIVERFNGEIGFESGHDMPTVFWFTCPLEEEEPVQKTDATLPSQVTKLHNEKARVLHLEDDLEFAEIIKSALCDVADVTIATSVKDARRVIGAIDIDTVILDRSLADGFADSLIDEIVTAYPNARILALSAQETFDQDDRISVNLMKSRTKVSSLRKMITDGAA